MYTTTMKRIADELGVSITTVSKVLNHHADISAATRTRVLEAPAVRRRWREVVSIRKSCERARRWQA